jgi:hypothetical protein
LGRPPTVIFADQVSLVLPCFIGIFSGVNNAQHLATPTRSIPRGAFSAIGVSLALYLALFSLFGCAIERIELLDNVVIGPLIAWPNMWVSVPGVAIVGLGAALQCLMIVLLLSRQSRLICIGIERFAIVG